MSQSSFESPTYYDHGSEFNRGDLLSLWIQFSFEVLPVYDQILGLIFSTSIMNNVTCILKLFF